MTRLVLGLCLALALAGGLAAQQQPLTVTLTIPAAVVDDVRQVVRFHRGPGPPPRPRRRPT